MPPGIIAVRHCQLGRSRVEVNPADPSITIPIEAGSIFGEVGLISGRRRGATISVSAARRHHRGRNLGALAALKLQSQVPAAKKSDRAHFDRAAIAPDVRIGPETRRCRPAGRSCAGAGKTRGEIVVTEGADDKDIFIIRRGSMIVEKAIGDRPVFLSYLPAGSYFGEMAVIDGSLRTATVKAAIKSEVIRLPGEGFLELLEKNPALRERALKDMAGRRATNSFIESRKDSFGSAVDLYSETAQFLVEFNRHRRGDRCAADRREAVHRLRQLRERPAPTSHDGLSRLDREAGAHLMPTSMCRHHAAIANTRIAWPIARPTRSSADRMARVFIDETCIGCGNCQRNCPYGVIRMDPKAAQEAQPCSNGCCSARAPGRAKRPIAGARKRPRKKARGPRPSSRSKCDMCSGIDGGPACVRACPTGAAIRVSPDKFLTFTKLTEDAD